MKTILYEDGLCIIQYHPEGFFVAHDTKPDEPIQRAVGEAIKRLVYECAAARAELATVKQEREADLITVRDVQDMATRAVAAVRTNVAAELAALQQWRDYVLSALRGLKRWKIDWKGQRVLADERGMWTGYAALQTLLAPPAPKQEARQPAEVFPPSEYIREEMEKRGWDRLALLDATGTDRVLDELVMNVVDHNACVTPDIAAALDRAFGTGPDVWLNLDRVWRERQQETQNG